MTAYGPAPPFVDDWSVRFEGRTARHIPQALSIYMGTVELITRCGIYKKSFYIKSRTAFRAASAQPTCKRCPAVSGK